MSDFSNPIITFMPPMNNKNKNIMKYTFHNEKHMNNFVSNFNKFNITFKTNNNKSVYIILKNEKFKDHKNKIELLKNNFK